jgi:hypothetical protein
MKTDKAEERIYPEVLTERDLRDVISMRTRLKTDIPFPVGGLFSLAVLVLSALSRDDALQSQQPPTTSYIFLFPGAIGFLVSVFVPVIFRHRAVKAKVEEYKRRCVAFKWVTGFFRKDSLFTLIISIDIYHI